MIPIEFYTVRGVVGLLLMAAYWRFFGGVLKDSDGRSTIESAMSIWASRGAVLGSIYLFVVMGTRFLCAL